MPGPSRPCCYDDEFDDGVARRDLAEYLRRGPGGTTRALASALADPTPAGLTVLDIGGGVGGLHRLLLDPSVTTVSTPTLGQYIQAQQQVPTLLSLDQSLLLVWPHLVALLALTVLCFALAYVSFMRQEVRA